MEEKTISTQNDDLRLYKEILEHARIPKEYEVIMAHVPATLDELDEFIRVREIVGRKCCITALLQMLVMARNDPKLLKDYDEISMRLYQYLKEDGYDRS